ncbi:unnamed protein product [Gordionus sp. m RMFG-2023]
MEIDANKVKIIQYNPVSNLPSETNALIEYLTKVWNDGDALYPDIIVNANSIKYKCHRLLLGSFSNYFKNILETTDDILEICFNMEDGKSVGAIFKNILEFFYTGNIMITQDNIKDIYNVSVYLDIKLLRRECEKILGHWFKETYSDNQYFDPILSDIF